MSLEQDINKDFIQAFKGKRKIEASALRMLRSALKNLAIAKKTDSLDEEDVLAVLKKEVKKRRDSIESFKIAGRDDLVSKEEAEAKILQKYMPAMLSEVAIGQIIDNVISDGYDNFALVMKEVMIRTKGQADGNMVKNKVQQKLNL